MVQLLRHMRAQDLDLFLVLLAERALASFASVNSPSILACDSARGKKGHPTKVVTTWSGNADWKWHYDYAFGKRPAEELYDLRQDPDQTLNIAADPAYAKQKEELSTRLLKILADSKDPRVLEEGKTFENPPFTDVPPEIQERRKTAPVPKAGTT